MAISETRICMYYYYYYYYYNYYYTRTNNRMVQMTCVGFETEAVS